MQSIGRRLWQRCSCRQLSSSSSGRGKVEELSPAKAGSLANQLREKLNNTKNCNESSLSLSTLLSHAGLSSSNGNSNAPLSPPIDLATTYERPADGNYGEGGLIYSRSCNPTRKLLQDAIGQLEVVSQHGQIIAPTFAFSSGMAAVASLLLAQKSPVKVLVPEDIYHGVPTQLHVCLNDHGIVHESVDMTNAYDIRQTIEHHIDSKSNAQHDGALVVWMETPSNPLCQVTDIQSICDLVNDVRCQHQNANIITVVDSTWAPPVITRPLLLGADAVLHSGTKYLGGHSDVLLGTISCSPINETGKFIAERLKSVQTSIGAVASPLECWLTLRGLRSLHVRVERQCQTAMKLANYLDGHEHIAKVHYPGLASHPQHATAKRQMAMYGGMLSFEVKNESMAMAVAGAVSTIRRATSLGGTETLIEHRASIEPPERRTSPPGLLRMSVGLEDADDLIDDLKIALDIASQICDN
ncbi:cystathionine gamma-synthase [Skeletonema marinoi]|uniref:cystathionine gamma-lyase n=1 Tax=Skeletonema marinoi TaxID=267567 RepID=A0AAD8YBK2_9STRA|nr:cystathionine gamma-synthase [Skeletonema marinoi]